MIKSSRILSIILLLVVVSASWTSAIAASWNPTEEKWGAKIDSYYYFFEDGKAIITNSNFSETGSASGGGAYKDEVVIPTSVTYEGETYPVVGIQDFAFYNCPNLVVVNIPNTIKTIGQSAFRNCSNLTRINVAQDSQDFYSEDGILYDKFRKELIAIPANRTITDGKYTVASTATSIREYAMSGCKQLKTVTLPNTLKSIGKYAFNACSNLVSINIPSGLTQIGEYAFNNCQALAIDVVIPTAIQSIPDALFQNCANLKSVTLHNEVSTIGWSAFKGCTSLKKVVLPNGIKEINTGAFANTGLTSIEIPAGLKTIPSSAFANTKLTNVVLHEGLETIESYAFSNIGTTLASVNIPKSVKSIKDNAFDGSTIKDIYVNNIPSKISLSSKTPFVKNAGTKIHVFTLLANAFKSSTNWSNYKDYIVADIEIVHVTGITLDKNQVIVGQKASGTIAATIAPYNAEVKDVVYTTSNKDIVAITNSETGTFSTGSMDGEATITCTALDGSGAKATCIVKVVNNFIDATSVTVLNAPSTMDVNETIKLKAEVGGKDATLKNVLWTSTDESIATVTLDGELKAIAPGIVTIIALSGDGNASAEFDVAVGYATFALTDATDYTNNKDLFVKEITYTRNFKNDKWQALYVPFEIEAADIQDKFEVARLNNIHQYDYNEDGIVDDTFLEFFKVKSGKLNPNTPYIIKAKEIGTWTITVNNATLHKAENKSIECSSIDTRYTFYGTYQTVSGPVLVANKYYAYNGGELNYTENVNASLKGFRWYLDITDKNGNNINLGKISTIIIDDNEATGIEQIENAISNDIEAIYDINGRKLNSFCNGINIVKYSDGTTKKITK